MPGIFPTSKAMLIHGCAHAHSCQIRRPTLFPLARLYPHMNLHKAQSIPLAMLCLKATVGMHISVQLQIPFPLKGANRQTLPTQVQIRSRQDSSLSHWRRFQPVGPMHTLGSLQPLSRSPAPHFLPTRPPKQIPQSLLRVRRGPVIKCEGLRFSSATWG